MQATEVFHSREDQIRHNFELFHEANPQVWELFTRFTRQLIDTGFKHYSADAIVHQIRWHTAIETGEIVKLNNNHTAYYARLWRREFPKDADFFRSRSPVSGGQPAIQAQNEH